MNWKEKFADKIVSAEEAVGFIQSGDNVHTTMFSALPMAIVEELGKQKDRLENVNVFMGFGGGMYRPLAKACNGHVNINSLFYGPAERTFRYKMGSDIKFQVLQLSKCMEDRAFVHPADVVIMNATPPCEDGLMSFGPIPIDTALCEKARNVIVQINENLPFVWGDGNMVNIKDVTCAVVQNDKLPVSDPVVPSAADLKIAEIIAERIPDGACIQFGIGGLSEAMGKACMGKKHLGIHTELFVDSMIDLIESGAVDNSMKNIDKGISVFGFAMGSDKLNKFLNHNPACRSRSFSYSNDPYTIAKNDNMISVNSAMQVDLTGQVASEGIGFKQYSGIGGQLDYVRGSQLSKGGHSFIALDSVREDKTGNKSSKIVLAHPLGTPITTPRSEVEYIVTEYGIADIKYCTIDERVKRLIAIAHPDFREHLTAEAKEAGLIL